MPFARLTFGHNFVYQDDNARPHTARTVVTFMANERIEHKEWLAVSPDMNPIENMWSEVTRTMDTSATSLLIWRNCDRQSLMHDKLFPFKPWQP